MKTPFQLLALLTAMSTGLSAAEIPLGGRWQLQLDPTDEGVQARLWDKPFDDAMQLPGTTAIAGKGQRLSIAINLERPAMQSLHQRFRYMGPAWYRRTVKVPADWRAQDIMLTLERIIWESRVWVNGHEAGSPQLSLTTPHRHDVTRWIKPGAENTITIRIDNREKVPIGVMGHSYTDETQTIWNGIVGAITLAAQPKVRIERVRLRPDLTRGGVNLTVFLINNSDQKQTLPLAVNASAGSGFSQVVEVSQGQSSQTFFLGVPAGTVRWSEFAPAIHTVTATLGQGSVASSATGTFGLREFKAAGRGFAINGQRTFLRGTVQCAEFPLTGHPDMTGVQWEKIFSTAKAYGLNHLRFHSWCPPEAAFVAADRHGFYLQVELPNWTFKMGGNPPVDAWLKTEAENIFREYGNHPSFVMLSLGNELDGDFAWLDQCIAEFRQQEPQLLFTSTTFAFAPRGKLPGPRDDFFISQETQCGWVRGQGFLNNTRPNTVSDYAAGASCIPIPLVTHEVGQYVVYPNLAELPKYEGTPMRATAWEAIKADLERKQRVSEAARYTRESGKLAVLLYKEDLERALRTKDLAGIQLLQLQDFPGQSTATVGLLDAFWDSKGLITPEEFRRFCGSTVPLIRMPKMVFQNDETFEAGVEIAHFGPAPLTNATVVWRLTEGEKAVSEGKFEPGLIPIGNGTTIGRIAQPLGAISRASRLDLTVEIAGSAVCNNWSIWVYPAEVADTVGDVQVFASANDDCARALRGGRKVLLLPGRAGVKTPIDGRFIPVFWSPLHFPNQPGTLGAMIDPAHPVWHEFPTGSHTDWQWWELLSRSFAVDLDAVPSRPEMPFRFVDRFNRNALPAALFEAKVGAGRLLVCTLDIAHDLDTRLTARQLRRSILSYMRSDRFRPQSELSEQDLRKLFAPVPYQVRASSSHASYAAELAIDGDPKTFWHTDWIAGEKLPASLTVELDQTALLRGFNYAPRGDLNRGRISQYSVEISQDGRQWLTWLKQGEFPDSAERQTVAFDKPIQGKFLRLTALADYGAAGHAAIAEIEPIIGEITTDVRHLGIVPGFNDKR